MLPYLAVEMESRGRDSWGASNGTDILKRVDWVTKSWFAAQAEIASWTGGIFHTRGASVGRKDIVENAHPFVGTYPDGRRVIGIHNGGISNHASITTKYSRKEVDVDSEHLWLHRAAGLPWSEFHGYANVAFWEPPPLGEGEVEFAPPQLYIARVKSDDLHCVRVEDGGLLFCSTMAAIHLAAAMVGTSVTVSYKLEESRVYRLDESGVWETREYLPFGTYEHIAGTHGSRYTSHLAGIAGSGRDWVYSHDGSINRTGPGAGPVHPPVKLGNQCFCCGERPITDARNLMCPICFSTIVDAFQADELAETAVGGPPPSDQGADIAAYFEGIEGSMDLYY